MRDWELIAAMLAGAAVLTACGAQPEANNAAEAQASAATSNEAIQNEIAMGAPAAVTEPGSNAASAGPGLPAVEEKPRFVGRWAADARSCPELAWIWTDKRLVTPGHVVCQFDEPGAVPGGYDIPARCTAEAPPEDDVIKVRFAESAKAMLVEARSFAPVGLVYCGPIE